MSREPENLTARSMNVGMASGTPHDKRVALASDARTGHVIDARHEAYRKYLVLDQDNNEVERTAGELADGNRLMMGVELWRKNFGAAIARVRAWCDTSAADIRAALVDVRSNKVLFYLVPTSDRYDLSLGDRMTALEVELGGSAGIGYVESLQVPANSLERFAGPMARVAWLKPGDDLFADASTPAPTGSKLPVVCEIS